MFVATKKVLGDSFNANDVVGSDDDDNLPPLNTTDSEKEDDDDDEFPPEFEEQEPRQLNREDTKKTEAEREKFIEKTKKQSRVVHAFDCAPESSSSSSKMLWACKHCQENGMELCDCRRGLLHSFAMLGALGVSTMSGGESCEEDDSSSDQSDDGLDAFVEGLANALMLRRAMEGLDDPGGEEEEEEQKSSFPLSMLLVREGPFEGKRYAVELLKDFF